MIGRLATLLLATQAVVALAQDVGGGAPRVQLGVSVAPDTVTVGDPFVVQVRVRAPRGASIAFPAGPDSGATVAALDPRALRGAAGTVAADTTAIYRLVAWDVGTLSLALPDVIVRAAGGEQRVSLAAARVFVRSVLPADSAARVPKPPRPVLEHPAPWWRWWLIGALVLLALGLLVWWLWRRRRRQALAAPAADPFDLAERDFERVERLGLLEAGERGRYVALIVEVLRDYLARRVDGASTSLTSTELLRQLTGHHAIPVDRLGAVLVEADLVKFARRPVTAERARELGREARAIVRDVNTALMPAPEEPVQSAKVAA